MIGATEKSGKNNLDTHKNRVGKKFVIRLLFGRKRVTYHWGKKTMTAFIFIFVYYLGKPIFVNFGVSDRRRFFTALTLSFILETTIFAITGASGYKPISP